MLSEETTKRLNLAQTIAEHYSDFTLGIILAGSVAYSKGLHVTKDSNIDLVMIVNDLKSVIDRLTLNPNANQP